MMHLFGRISKPSAAALGAAEFIASLPDIPVNRSPLLASAAAQRTLGISGHTWQGSLERQGRRESSSRTSATILRSASQKLRRIYADWATCLKRDCLRRLKLAHLSFAKGSSSWPSPRPCSGERSSGANRTEFYRRWPTALASDAKDCGGHRGKPDSLTSASRLWQTPAGDSFRSRSGNRKNELGLAGQAKEIGNKVAGGGVPSLDNSNRARFQKLRTEEAHASRKQSVQRARYSSGQRVFPPGPDDEAGWKQLLATDPSLEPAICRVVDGVSGRVDRLRALGNAVVPLVAAHAYSTLETRLFGGLLNQ